MNVLGMFARCPEPGRTKTRLAATLGHDAAARLSAAFIRDLIERFQDVPDRFVAAVTPDDPSSRRFFQPLLKPGSCLTFQPQASLGERIAWFFRSELGGERRRVVLIGSDSPDLPAELIQEGFARLGGVPAVIAPARDGGFVLLGMNSDMAPAITGAGMQQVTWSSPSTCDDTIGVLEDCGVVVARLPAWDDVDTADDLDALARRIRQQTEQGSERSRCRNTRAVLSELGRL